MRKVYIVGMAFVGLFESLFRKQGGWEVVSTPEEAEFLQFTGGADINPMLYGDQPHPTTSYSVARDRMEVDMYNAWVGKKKMLGVCRGLQLFAALNDGKLYQDVDGHGNGNHVVTDLSTGLRHIVSSVHHQMVRNTHVKKGAVIIAIASESRDKKYMINGVEQSHGRGFGDIEAMYYPDTQSLGVQFHPEFGPKSCTDYYFELIDREFPELADDRA